MLRDAEINFRAFRNQNNDSFRCGKNICENPCYL